MAKDAIIRAQDLLHKKQETNYQGYSEGEQVWLDRKHLKTSLPTTKLALKWFGPFKILTKISEVVYQLELPKTWKIHNIFHTSLLSPYVEMNLHGPNFTEPLPDIIKEEPKYKVEEILGSRRVGKKHMLEYKVRWKGYLPCTTHGN
jgi:hypothetical protein